ncbi:hypothetical protein VTH06DRAFT_5073 [Thermothelomyces fergusii]
MKTAKPPAPEGVTGSSRRQPVRQTRVNPPRTSSLNRNNPLAGAPASEQPINILPGVTHFADAITALPRELVRHFTLLKEVDAKIFAPEAALLQLLHDALNTPPPDLARPVHDALSSTASVSAPVSTTGPANPAAPPSDATASSVFDPANIPRRALFRDTALKIQEILVSLEEKNHVLATANDALQKQLARIEDIWPHLEAEFSEEAKWGSATHWAYVENRQAKTNDKQTERSRREGAATLSAAAQALAEEAAARSSDRKQAMAAKKNAKNQTADADSDKVQDSGKKAQGTKSRKPLPDHGPVGLGITSAPTGAASANKRRKVAETKSNGAPAERAMGSVYGTNSTRRGTTSPSETPAPEGGNKKRKGLPTSSSQAKKSRTNAAMSPSVASSPVVGALPDPVKPGRTSPAPSVTASRPATSRARQNSTTHSNVENSRQRLPSVASNKPSGNSQGTPDPAQPSNGTKTSTDSKTQKEATVPIMTKPSSPKAEAEEPPSAPEPTQDDNDDNSGKQTDEQPAQSNKEAAPLGAQSTPASRAKTKSGRASKPSTPAVSTLTEAASSNASATTSRSRPSRGTENSANNAAPATVASNQNNSATAKRSHKKGASISATATSAAQGAAAAAAASSSSSTSTGASSSALVVLHLPLLGGRKDKTNGGTSSGAAGNNSSNNSGTKKAGAGAENEDDADEDDDQDVGDEDVYCYCNQVSYGEMVACDGEGCPREWFHLECVGLKVAPEGNAKWYCEDCKKRLKITERR